MDNPEPTAYDRAESEAIAKQIRIELRLLRSIERSLRTTLQWMTRDRGNNRKLSTLRSVARSFERQLSRTRVIADQPGYMHVVTAATPDLTGEVQDLRKAREALQTGFEGIVLRLEYVSPDDAAAFQGVCAELESYLDDLNAHGRRELRLLQRSFPREEDDPRRVR
jgi:hypothetical protein